MSLEKNLTKIIIRNNFNKFKEKIHETKKDLNKININSEEDTTLLHFLGNSSIL